MPVTRKGLEAHNDATKKGDETTALLRQLLEQQKQILAALQKLLAK